MMAKRATPKRTKRSPSASDAVVYQKTVLPNGLRIISEQIQSVRSISLGAWVDVGSRYEQHGVNGVSHLIEHMVFKGTKNRSASAIASSLESIGGILNAFTSREQTCYTARILDEHLPAAIDVLADIMCHATFTPGNFSKEKMVICEEIKESLDTPSDHVHDIFSEAFWGDHPLGRPIMGTMETIKGMDRRKMLDYVAENYRTGSVVIAASGSISHRKLVEACKRSFLFPEGERKRAEQAPTPLTRRVSNGEGKEQVHICIGFPGLPITSGERTAASAVSTYLGGGMSSVLFQKVREERGLAYSVYSYSDSYADAGVFGIYLATDTTHAKQAFDIVQKEVRKVAHKPLSSVALDQIKAQMKGQLTLAMESTSSRMSRLGRNELMLGEYRPLERSLRDIDKLTPNALLKFASEAFGGGRMTVATLGPVDLAS